jgi:hypothetical protein
LPCSARSGFHTVLTRAGFEPYVSVNDIAVAITTREKKNGHLPALN